MVHGSGTSPERLRNAGKLGGNIILLEEILELARCNASRQICLLIKNLKDVL